MLRERPKETGRLRCPWCQGEGAGDRWVTCERDDTPIHLACLSEFGMCPICREPVDDSQVGAATSRTTRRQIVIGRDLLAGQQSVRSALRVEVLPVPTAVSEWAGALRREYRSTLSQGAVLAAWGVCTFFGAGALGLFSAVLAFLVLVLAAVIAAALHANAGRPRVSGLIPVGAGRSDALEAIAARIVEGDLEALETRGVQARAARQVRELVRQLERGEATRLDHHRAALERRTPIEDAQRIRGIGDGITSTLRAHGIASLADLLERGTAEGLPQIGPKRASLLLTWAHDRAVAIDRLLRAGAFVGRAELDREFDARQRPIREEAERAAARANEALARLVAWVGERASLRQRLDRALGRGEAN